MTHNANPTDRPACDRCLFRRADGVSHPTATCGLRGASVTDERKHGAVAAFLFNRCGVNARMFVPIHSFA